MRSMSVCEEALMDGDACEWLVLIKGPRGGTVDESVRAGFALSAPCFFMVGCLMVVQLAAYWVLL